MKIFNAFKQSALELKELRNVVTCGLLMAISMVIESFTIELPFAKINFAYLAIASIGVLFGPTVSLFAGAMCDILGFIVHPVGGFLPLYTLLGAAQGLIYGVIAYRRYCTKTGKRRQLEMIVRTVIARCLDVVLINLICNTAANLHYGFLKDQTLGAAIVARISKNLLELPFDVILIAAIIPAILIGFEMTVRKRRTAA